MPTAEIQKLYSYTGYDPKSGKYTEPGKQIEWVKIHNLPDHVYFNHSQHIRAGKVQCQTCHGNITQMNEVKQFAELSMGWCINCHRTTKVISRIQPETEINSIAFTKNSTITWQPEKWIVLRWKILVERSVRNVTIKCKSIGVWEYGSVGFILECQVSDFQI